MKQRRIFASLLLAAIALVGGATWLDAQRPARAADASDASRAALNSSTRAGAVAASQAVTSTFAYQGFLEEDDQPVTGSRQMGFTLYADQACSVQVGASQSQPVSVDNGTFSVNLGFDPAHVNGQALWLETEVEGTAIGCQPIQPAPYALSLRPGSTISGAVGSESQLVDVRSGATGLDEGVLGAKLGRRTSLGYPVGLYGYAYDFGAVGVWGVSDSEFGWGVNGVANGTNSIGVRGIANAFTSTTYGVYGEANSPGGYAGYFEHTASTGDGVAFAATGPMGGVITGTSGPGLAAYGSGTGENDAISAESDTDDGVVGYSDGSEDLNNGVIGFTDGGYGVYGFSNAGGQYAGYFSGPIRATSCTGCTMAYVARNTSDRTLQVGDVVQADGIEPPMAGQQQPVMQVRAAESTGTVLGVVTGRTEMTKVEPGTDQAKPGPHYGPTGGAAKPGDYMIVVVQGMAQVRVDPAVTLQTGDPVGVSADGATPAVDTTGFGMVLDEADADGLAWVMVGFE